MILEEAAHESSEPVRMTPFIGPIAWTCASLSPDDDIVKINEACRRELNEVVSTLRANPLPTALLRPDDFSLERCREMMREALQLLTEGPGFVIVDRLPMELWTKQEATAVYWLLAQMVSRPVAQSWDGKMIYDVRDLGKPPGNGVRLDITSAEQNFHTDNSYNICPPNYVALLCLRPAKQGGVSSIVSFYTVYNQMIERHPHLLPRLFRSYIFDRQREHAPGDATLISHPLFQNEGGRMVCRLSRRHVIAGYEMAQQHMDEETLDALQTLEAVMLEPEWTRDFRAGADSDRR
ncbi:hypothetical protein BPUN_1076 [Candidatus Paraburkholderia kirkii]|nr:hypothetical protein BPUN_1076 [Candidatus Paraburkholderia kirkii]